MARPSLHPRNFALALAVQRIRVEKRIGLCAIAEACGGARPSNLRIIAELLGITVPELFRRAGKIVAELKEKREAKQ